MRGKSYYSFIQNSNTQHTFSIYLEYLAKRLDHENKNWRKKTVIVFDNVSLHTRPTVQKVIAEKQLPVFMTAPASFDALPIELWFAKVK
jgi:transposase